MKTRRLLCLLTVLCLLCSLCCPAYAAVTAVKTPVDPAQTKLLWQLQLGKTYADAPSVPAYADGSIYITSREKLYRLNAETGEILQTAPISKANGYATKPVCIADGKVFCPLADGTVQAFDAMTLSPLWTAAAPNGGQPVTEIVYADGQIYTGFWNDIADDADFLCLDAQSGETRWSVTRTGGYYGSAPVVNNGCVYFGGDTGTGEPDGDGSFECRSAADGTLLDSLTVTGDLRNLPALADNTLYFATKGGLLYAVALEADGSFGAVRTLALGGAATATPVISGGTLYLGVQTSGYKGRLAVIDAQTLALRYAAEMPGYPACTALVSTGYEAETGLTYIYAVCNTPPGALAVIADRPGATAAAATALYTPTGDARGYALSTVAVSENGVLYYKNDSGYLFALAIDDATPEPEPEPEPEPPAPMLWQRIVAWITARIRAIRSFFQGLFQ